MAVESDFSSVIANIKTFINSSRSKVQVLSDSKIYDNIPEARDLKKYDLVLDRYKEAIQSYGEINKALATALDAEMAVRNMLYALGNKEGRGDTVMYKLHKETLQRSKDDLFDIITALRYHKEGCERVMDFYKSVQFIMGSGW